MNVFQVIQTFILNPSSHDNGTYKYMLPFILVSTVALWLLPGLLAKATGRLVYYFSRRALRGAASSDVVLESGPEGGY
jgi:cytochrome c-type biogenesis protein CcmH/NrfF